MTPWAVVPCNRYSLMYIVELLAADPTASKPLNAHWHPRHSAPRRCCIPLRQAPLDPVAVEQRLLRFPAIEKALATASPARLIVVCRGREDVAAWIESVDELSDSRPGGARAS